MSAQPIGKTTTQAANTAVSRVVQRAREVIADEISVLRRVSDGLGETLAEAVDILLRCRGKVVTCGIGKAGIIAQKLSASLSSTGTPSTFLHPSEAVHGDLGVLQACDVVIVLSYSGETEEITRLLPSINRSCWRSIAITARSESTLAVEADCAILLGKHAEACRLNLAPTSSTTAMMAVGDALALIASEQRKFTEDDFARFHPGGSLGKRLAKVSDVMRPLHECRIAQKTASIRDVMIAVSKPGRRTGAIMLVDQSGVLAGIFTDSDLARLLEKHRSESILDQPVESVMSRGGKCVDQAAMLGEAVAILSESKISELPVVDQQSRPCGIVDVTDVIELITPHPDPNEAQSPDQSDVIPIF